MSPPVYSLPQNQDWTFWQPAGVFAVETMEHLEHVVDKTGHEIYFPPSFDFLGRCDRCERSTNETGAGCKECDARACLDCLEVGEQEHTRTCSHRGDTDASHFVVDFGRGKEAYDNIKINAAFLAALAVPPLDTSFLEFPSPPMPTNPTESATARLPATVTSPEDLAAALLDHSIPGVIVGRADCHEHTVQAALSAQCPLMARPATAELEKGHLARTLRQFAWRNSSKEGLPPLYRDLEDVLVTVVSIASGQVVEEMLFAEAMDGIQRGEKWRAPDLVDWEEVLPGEAQVVGPFGRKLQPLYNATTPVPSLQAFDGHGNIFHERFYIFAAGSTGPYCYLSGPGGITSFHADVSGATNTMTPAFGPDGKAIWAFMKWEEWSKASDLVGDDIDGDVDRYSMRVTLNGEIVRKLAAHGIRFQYFVQEVGDCVVIPGGIMHAVISLTPSLKIAADFRPPQELKTVKMQEQARAQYYLPRKRAAESAGTADKDRRDSHEIGMVDLASVSERVFSVMANLGKDAGGEVM